MNVTHKSKAQPHNRPPTTLRTGLVAALRPTSPIDIKAIGPLTTAATRLGSPVGTLLRVAIAGIESGGILFDGLTRWRLVVILTAVISMIVDQVARPQSTVETAIVLAVVLFVARQSFLFFSFTPNGVAHWLRSRLGVERGGEAYEGITALFFYHRSYSYLLLVEKTAFMQLDWLLPYAGYLQVAGWGCIGLGFIVNSWAYLSIGRPAYYYLDMYYGRFLQPFSDSGLYRWLSNPMYSVGQLPSYGLALLHGSWIGLLFSVANHVCCYVFYHRFERPHIRAVQEQG